MAGLHNLIATALAAKAAAVAGMAGGSATPLDSLSGTPYLVIGPPRGQLTPSNWERMFIVFPMHLFYARISSADRDQTAINDLLDLVIAAFRLNITLGVPGVVEAVIASWDTNKVQDVGSESYQLIEFLVSVEVDQPAAYTA